MPVDQRDQTVETCLGACEHECRHDKVQKRRRLPPMRRNATKHVDKYWRRYSNSQMAGQTSQDSSVCESTVRETLLTSTPSITEIECAAAQPVEKAQLPLYVMSFTPQRCEEQGTEATDAHDGAYNASAGAQDACQNFQKVFDVTESDQLLDNSEA